MRLNSSSAGCAAHTRPWSDLLAPRYWDTVGPLGHRTASMGNPRDAETRSDTGQSGFFLSG